MRISEKLLRLAERRVQVLRDNLGDCHPDDWRQREHITNLLREAEANLDDKRLMVASETHS